ncbi:MAG TPA: type II TA system antitoxin MqsA family protein [Polyangiaceae bacterium]|nr:type II TA system antitoxin MqsA family protein [Polyangiaceae bacterium]
MKCEQCGGPVTVSHENYSYTASGLPNVTLVGVEVRRCTECGEHEVVIPKIEKLHRTIAMAVVGKKTRLTAEEIRFLRKYLGWSGADFARHMGVTPESISRWENEKERMNPVADRLLRLMVVTKAPVADYSLDALADLQDKSTPTRMKLYASPKDWRAEVAA